MAYSFDFRRRVIFLIEEGKSISEVSRLLKVGRSSIYDWLSRGEDLSPKYVKRRFRKLDWDLLRQHVSDYPDALLRERASYFGVHIHAIWYALREMKISYKKNPSLHRKRLS